MMDAPAERSGAQRLSLANDHGALDELGAWLAEIAARDSLPARAAFQLDLVLTEAVTNVMDYAHSADGGGRIDLVYAIEAGSIRIEIADDGPPFDPTVRAEVVLPSSLDAATPGGLGIHLMRRYTLDMAYRRDNGRNILSMRLPLDPTPAPA
jgi:anti-sigma regulatory factor (Ser/Thr protein kinase)